MLALLPFAGTAWRFLMSPLGKGVMVAVLVFGAYQTGHWRGDSYRNKVWVAKIEAEREKQEQTVARSELKALGEITRLTTELEDSNALNIALQSEAENDPNANRPAIGIDGVRRLNKIAPRRPK